MKTLPELIASVRRETSMRLAVYPNRVANRKMTQEQADHEIACMQQVLGILNDMDPHKHPQQLSMFNDTDRTKLKKT